jgi:hypothetical protein
MKLITTTNNDCVAASLAMLFDVDLGYIETLLFTALTKPFSGQWSGFPKVPDMNIICDWACQRGTALVPFEYDPQCTPHKSCPPVSVYPQTTRCPHETADAAFDKQMEYGPGLIEGTIIGREVGHMCAWDGKVIYDPRGYCYTRNVAKEKFGYQITRFWLAVKGKTL